MNIGIVGGSIAGCCAAILLLKEGHQVSVFERSSKTLVGRGGGIGTTSDVVNQIMKEGLIKNAFSYFSITKMPFIGKNETNEPYGKTAWALPMDFCVFHWNELWKNLRSNVPDSCYYGGVEIINSRTKENKKVEITFKGGGNRDFDLVLFADGYQSLGRQILFPKKNLRYRGYILWRGLLPESEMGQAPPLKDEILRLSYVNNPGHNVVYFIPDSNGAKAIGRRIYNWAAYITIPDYDLDMVMTDKNEKMRTGTLPPGTMKKENERKLKEFLSVNIPSFYANIVKKTTDSYIQVIYTLDLDKYYSDRMCLIGDAGMVIQPFTGSGVFKGYNNAKDLIFALNQTTSIDKALNNWSEKQIKNGKKLLLLGEQMEKAFIWNQPDFSTITEDEAAEWWKTSVTFPDNFSYQKRKNNLKSNN